MEGAGGSILEPSPSHYWSLLLSSLPMKADLPHGLDPKPFFSEVWLLYALPPGLTQASSEKSVLVRHHHGSCLGEPVLCLRRHVPPRTFQGSPLRAMPGQVGACISHTQALAESSTHIHFLPSGWFAPEEGYLGRQMA